MSRRRLINVWPKVSGSRASRCSFYLGKGQRGRDSGLSRGGPAARERVPRNEQREATEGRVSEPCWLVVG